MDLLSLTETWLDILAAMLGVLSTLVAVRTAIRLLEWSERESLAPSSTLSLSQRRGEWIGAPVTTPQPSLVLAGRPFDAPESLPPILPPQSSAPRPSSAPLGLAFKRIKGLGSQQIRLSLRNQGGKLHFLRVEPGPYQEVEVTYTPPVFREKETYTCGTALNFTLRGHDIDLKTYQFWVFFQDEKGQTFKQEIMGLGLELPLVEPPACV